MAPQGSKPHESCKCPKCAPGEWLVADLIAEIRNRDDVFDVLVEAAVKSLIYRESDHHRELLRRALVALDEVGGIPL